MDKKAYDILNGILDDLDFFSKGLNELDAQELYRIIETLHSFIQENRGKYVQETLAKEDRLAKATLELILDETGRVLIYDRQGKPKMVTPIAYNEGSKIIVHFLDIEDKIVSTYVGVHNSDILSLEYNNAIAIAKALDKAFVTEII